MEYMNACCQFNSKIQKEIGSTQFYLSITLVTGIQVELNLC